MAISKLEWTFTLIFACLSIYCRTITTIVFGLSSSTLGDTEPHYNETSSSSAYDSGQNWSSWLTTASFWFAIFLLLVSLFFELPYCVLRKMRASAVKKWLDKWLDPQLFRWLCIIVIYFSVVLGSLKNGTIAELDTHSPAASYLFHFFLYLPIFFVILKTQVDYKNWCAFIVISALDFFDSSTLLAIFSLDIWKQNRRDNKESWEITDNLILTASFFLIIPASLLGLKGKKYKYFKRCFLLASLTANIFALAIRIVLKSRHGIDTGDQYPFFFKEIVLTTLSFLYVIKPVYPTPWKKFDEWCLPMDNDEAEPQGAIGTGQQSNLEAGEPSEGDFGTEGDIDPRTMDDAESESSGPREQSGLSNLTKDDSGITIDIDPHNTETAHDS